MIFNGRRIWTYSKFFGALAIWLAIGLMAPNLAAQTPSDSDELSRIIQNGSIEEKRDALFTIRNLQTAEASRLAVPALTDLSEIVRATAVGCLVSLGPEDAARALIPMLEDVSAFVRKEAAFAVGREGFSSAVPRLVTLLQSDPAIDVRAAAAFALGIIGDTAAVESLAAVVAAKPTKKTEFLRRSAARSLGQIAQFLQTGESQLTTPDDFLPEADVQPDTGIYRNLLPTHQVLQFAQKILLATLNNKKEFQDVRREAAFAIGAIGAPDSIPVLKSYLHSDDLYLAEICRNAIFRITGIRT